jgi:hypothetical protein
LKKIFLLLLSPLIFGNVLAQNEYFAKYINFGFSPTYIWDNRTEPIPFNHAEITLNFNLSLPITKRLNWGVQSLPIHTITKEYGTKKSNYLVYGSFFQVDLMNKLSKKDKFSYKRLMLEISANMGDYCICKDSKFGEMQYFKKSEIFYLGYGGSYELVSKNEKWGFEFGFYIYNNLNTKNSIGYTQYIIGINKRFRKKESPIINQIPVRSLGD